VDDNYLHRGGAKWGVIHLEEEDVYAEEDEDPEVSFFKAASLTGATHQLWPIVTNGRSLLKYA
jgi:hypothetical protein